MFEPFSEKQHYVARLVEQNNDSHKIYVSNNPSFTNKWFIDRFHFHFYRGHES